MTNHTAVLKAKRADVFRHYRHPWVFSKGLATKPEAEAGELVRVIAEGGDHLGWAFYHPRNAICLRFVSAEVNPPDGAFWLSRLREAHQFRRSFLPEETDCYRLIHGENDGFPGLTIDVFGDVAVVQVVSAGFEKLKPQLVDWLNDLQPWRAIYEKSDTQARGQEGLKSVRGMLHGQVDFPIAIQEHGLRFEVNPEKDHKTGFYLDQRDQRAWLTRYAEHKSVLDLFCYNGGFSIAALMGGASRVLSVDSSETALEGVNRHLELNGLVGENHAVQKADIFELLRDKSDEPWDIVVLDPPSLSKHQSTKEKALRGYRKLNHQAAKWVAPGGLLLTFSCTGVVKSEDFSRSVFLGLRDANRNGRVLAHFTAGPDHPVALHFPEGEYLKGLCIRLD